MNTPIAEKIVNSYTIKIYQDMIPINSREEWDNFGHMICFHNRYELGDSHKWDIDTFQDFLAENEKSIICLNLYLYDHSGLTMSYSPFSSIFDSGQVGVIYATYEDIRKEYSVKRVTEAIKEKVLNILKAEVKTYDMYLTGQVYGYVIEDSEGKEIDSCWGYYEDPESIISECENNIVNHYDYQIPLGI